MLNNKTAPTENDIHPLIANRWSPVSFSHQDVTEEEVRQLLEAARWASSSFNEQPWKYVLGYKGDENFDKLADCLLEGNAWAKEVAVLMLSVAKLHFDHKHKFNRHAMYDTGAATTLMHLQATSMDLAMHQIAGFDMDKARKHFKIDDDFEPAAIIAIGRMDDELVERDHAERTRNDVDDMIWTK